IGMYTRLSVWISAVLGLYLLGVPHNFGKTGHGDGVLALMMFIFALSRCGDGWSVDSLFRAWRSRQPRPRRAISGEYTWPIRFGWILLSIVFCAAGIAKLRISGLEWVTSDNLSNMILQHYYGEYSYPGFDLGPRIAQIKWLCRVMAGGTLVLEVFFPLVLFFRWARWVFVPGMFLAQIGIGVLMGVWFTQFMFIYLFFVPWQWIADRIVAFAQRFGRYTMLYDGGCGLCKSVAATLVRLDLLHRIEPTDVVNDWAQVSQRCPKLDRQKCIDDMHVVRPDGSVVTRYDAYRAMAWAVPALWVFIPVLYLPPVRFIGNRIYGRIAASRHSAGCEIVTGRAS
ncbi:MAG: DCC1-like thiol-disulfide oxidoreductase family protein, partial [Tepidisphaeraceae bacterium]